MLPLGTYLLWLLYVGWGIYSWSFPKLWRDPFLRQDLTVHFSQIKRDPWFWSYMCRHRPLGRTRRNLIFRLTWFSKYFSWQNKFNFWHCTSWTYNTVRVQEEGSTVCGHHCIFYLVHRCGGHSMTDVTRLLENPVEVTAIVQNFVLLLLWKKK